MKNKTYFTKYLPVEGEINIGDKYFTKRGVLHTCGIKPNSEMLNHEENLKLAKLFLCSRDIQVYDKFHHNIYGQTFTCTSREAFIVREEHRQFSEVDCYKVVGEISPDAVWVTEGMEFDKDEWKKEEGFFETIRILIKCPTCKTFH